MTCRNYWTNFADLMLVIGWQEAHPAAENLFHILQKDHVFNVIPCSLYTLQDANEVLLFAVNLCNCSLIFVTEKWLGLCSKVLQSSDNSFYAVIVDYMQLKRKTWMSLSQPVMLLKLFCHRK